MTFRAIRSTRCAMYWRIGRRQDNFIGGDPHDGPMPMDYFCWLAVSDERRFVIDCGFTEEVSAQRKAPICAIRLMRLSFWACARRTSRTSSRTFITIMWATSNRLPKARFHLQETGVGFRHGQVYAAPVSTACPRSRTSSGIFG